MANNRANLTGTNIQGVSGAQHGAQRNAAAMQRAAAKAGQVGYEFGTLGGGATGAQGAQGVQLTGNNITGVSGAQHGAQRNAAAMQRAAQKSGQ
ncbi:MAG: hypothetical protein ACOY93_00225 [Bacillota bacterium]